MASSKIVFVGWEDLELTYKQIKRILIERFPNTTFHFVSSDNPNEGNVLEGANLVIWIREVYVLPIDDEDDVIPEIPAEYKFMTLFINLTNSGMQDVIGDDQNALYCKQYPLDTSNLEGIQPLSITIPETTIERLKSNLATTQSLVFKFSVRDDQLAELGTELGDRLAQIVKYAKELGLQVQME